MLSRDDLGGTTQKKRVQFDLETSSNSSMSEPGSPDANLKNFTCLRISKENLSRLNNFNDQVSAGQEDDDSD